MLSMYSLLDLVYENPLSVTIFAVFLVLFQNFLKSYLSRKRLPPGPYGLPFVGYSPFLMGKEAHKTVAKLTTKYGNVFTIQLEMNNVVILNDFEAVKEGLSNDSLLGRSYDGIFKCFTGSDSILDESGQVWRDHRQHYLNLLKDLGYGNRSMEDRVSDEIAYLIQFIDKTAGKPVDIQEFLTPSIANNICQVVLGYRLELDDPKAKVLSRFLYLVSKSLSPISLMNNSPAWVRWLLLKVIKAVNGTVIEDTLKFFKDEISRHQKSFNRNIIRDYIDGYLAQMEKKSEKETDTSFNLNSLLANSILFFAAGTDTTSTACAWNFLMAAKYPDYQQRMQIEIDEVVGSERIVTWDDRHRLPYTHAFINEVLRVKTTLAFNAYRRAEKDTHVLNHFIPKDTLICANLWANNHDLKIWTDPDQFNPNRFLTDDGKQLVNTEYLFNFSSGKRSCVGESLARIQVFLYFATILQRYTIGVPEGHVISLEEGLGVSLRPIEKPILVFNKRN